MTKTHILDIKNDKVVGKIDVSIVAMSEKYILASYSESTLHDVNSLAPIRQFQDSGRLQAGIFVILKC